MAVSKAKKSTTKSAKKAAPKSAKPAAKRAKAVAKPKARAAASKAASVKKNLAKAAPAKISSAKKTAASKSAQLKEKAAIKAKKAVTSAKKTAAKKTSAGSAKRADTRPAATKPSLGTLSQKKAPAVKKEKPLEPEFIAQQKEVLLAERQEYIQSAEALRAQAELLAQEMDPGDMQFDEESGEGGTANIDRERDLQLSAQARVAVDEIDRALAKMAAGRYGRCERCGETIAKARLRIIPHAALCIRCKSGGLAIR